jgi:hypothetical protein
MKIVKNTIKPHYVSILVLLFLVFGTSTQSYRLETSLLDASEISQLATGEPISRFYTKNDPVRYIPGSDEGRFTPLHTSGVELIWLYETDSWDALELSNVLLKVSGMEGLEYFSASRNRMRLLFEESYRLADDEQAADLQISSLPAKVNFEIFQKDLSFGKNVHSVELEASENALVFTIQNQTQMWYGMIPAIGPGGLEMVFMLVPVEEGILLYGNASVRTAPIPGLKNKATDSFSNRLQAILGWVLEEYGRN